MLRIEDVILEPPAPGETLDLAAVFGPGVPVELEIGSGKGGFLLNRARALPQRGFLGVEWANQFFRYAADRMVRWSVPNVRMMRTDASHLVRHHLPPASLEMIHIYHPDPWPKTRHHKRRLIQEPLVAALAGVLKPGGRLALQTDHAEYFAQMQRVVGAEPHFTPVAFDVPEAGVVEGQVKTNFEIKYLREGRPIYQLAVRRKV
jgi:tRNA (guanine-N7-)-methyltransferase